MTPRVLKLDHNVELAETVLARPSRFMGALTGMSMAALIALLAWTYFTEMDVIVTAPFRVRTVSETNPDFNAVSGSRIVAPVQGTIAEARLREGETPRAGDVLFKLDSRRIDDEIDLNQRRIASVQNEIKEYERMLRELQQERSVALEKSKAELKEAELHLILERERFAKEMENWKAGVKIAEAQVRQQEIELSRTQELVKKNALAPVEEQRAEFVLQNTKLALERARIMPLETLVRQAEGRLRILQGNSPLLEQQFILKRQEIELRLLERRRELEALQTNLINLQREQQRHVVRAEFDGVLTKVAVRVGDVVAAGRDLAMLAAREQLRIDAAVPARDIGKLKAGQTARLKFDAFDYRKYGTLAARVSYIAPDLTEIQGQPPVYMVHLTLEKPQFPTGEQVKIGMLGKTELIVDTDRILLLIVRALKGAVSF